MKNILTENFQSVAQSLISIDETTKKILIDYITYLELQDLKQSSIEARLWSLVTFFKYLEYKSINEITGKDVEYFAAKLKKSVKAKQTQRRDLINTRAFLQWYKADTNFFVNIKITKEKPDTSQKEYVTADDVKLLLRECKHQRDRAFIFMLWDSGARLGEMLALNVKDVKPFQYGVRIAVTGKTGTRDIILIDCVPDVQQWLNQYDGKDKDPLFPLIGKPRAGRLAHGGAQTLLKRLVEKAGINKRVYCHSFRHGRLTELSNLGLSEMQLRNYAGWTRESGMPAVYLHPEQKDTEKKLLKLRGIEVEESTPEPVMSTKKCTRCNTINPFDSKFCSGCSIILDTKLAIEKQEAEKASEAAKEAAIVERLKSELKDDYMKAMLELFEERDKKQAAGIHMNYKDIISPSTIIDKLKPKKD